jgi:hypothetical protein
MVLERRGGRYLKGPKPPPSIDGKCGIQMPFLNPCYFPLQRLKW